MPIIFTTYEESWLHSGAKFIPLKGSTKSTKVSRAINAFLYSHFLGMKKLKEAATKYIQKKYLCIFFKSFILFLFRTS